MRLYIDPGTGSMLFAIVIALVGLLFYVVRGLIIKIRFMISAGKQSGHDADTIPLVIFGEDRRYWPIFEPICRELDKKGFDVVYMTSSKEDPALKCTYPHVKAQFIGEGNKAFARMNFLRATIVFSTTPSLNVYQWKRSPDVKCYVHIPHAATGLTLYEMFGIDYYDVVLISGEYQKENPRKLEKLRGLPEKELVIVGTPYWDVMHKKIQEMPPMEDHQKTILLAPSWGPNSILNRFGSRVIKELLATGYHLIIRPHPQSFTSEKEMITALMEEFPAGEQIEWNRDTDNFDSLRRSDILVSDFSSIIYDYAIVFDKPVICALSDFDTSKYDAWWLDSPVWNLEVPPRLGAVLTEENLPDLKNIIDKAVNDTSYSEERQKVREETWANIGKSAEIAADYLIKKCNDLKAAEAAKTPAKKAKKEKKDKK